MVFPQLGVRSGLAPRANISKTGICMKLLLPSVSWASIYTHTDIYIYSPYPKPVLLVNSPVCSPIATCRASFDSECAVLPPSHSRSSHPISGRIITIYFMVLDPPVTSRALHNFCGWGLAFLRGKKSSVQRSPGNWMQLWETTIAWLRGRRVFPHTRRRGGPWILVGRFSRQCWAFEYRRHNVGMWRGFLLLSTACPLLCAWRALLLRAGQDVLRQTPHAAKVPGWRDSWMNFPATPD